MARKNDEKKRHQKQVDLRMEDYYTVRQILEDLIYDYHIDTKKEDKKKLENRLAELIRKGGYKGERLKEYKIKGNVIYYNVDEKEAIMEDSKIVKYFEKKGKIPKIYKSDYEIQKQLNRDSELAKELSQARREAAGLTEQDERTIQYVNAAQGEHFYLTADELSYLGLSGFVKTSELDVEDKEALEKYYEIENSHSIIKEKRERFFEKMKFEIMLTALFEEKFELNEDLLLADIGNFFIFYDMDLNSYTDDALQHPNTKRYKRSVERLLHEKKNYYSRKKKK